MTTAEKDYTEAKKLIAECDGEFIDLSELENLETIPPEIADFSE